MNRDRISGVAEEIANDILQGLSNGYDKELIIRKSAQSIMFLVLEIARELRTESNKAAEKLLDELNQVNP